MKRQQHSIKTVFCFLGFLLLSGCGTELTGPAPGDPRFAPVYPEVTPAKLKSNGSIYQEGKTIGLYGDRKAHRIGDVLTIRLEETTNAQKKADTRNVKQNANTFNAPTLFGHTIDELNFSTSSQQNFDSRGESKQSNNLQGNITVTVSNVLPNGNLTIQGESWISLNQGSEYVRLTGIVRADDIDADNTVSSRRVANARISYSGTGQVANSNRAGFLSRFFNAYWPY